MRNILFIFIIFMLAVACGCAKYNVTHGPTQTYIVHKETGFKFHLPPRWERVSRSLERSLDDYMVWLLGKEDQAPTHPNIRIKVSGKATANLMRGYVKSPKDFEDHFKRFFDSAQTTSWLPIVTDGKVVGLKTRSYVGENEIRHLYRFEFIGDSYVELRYEELAEEPSPYKEDFDKMLE